MNLVPLNDCLLVELTDGNELEGVDIPDKQFSTKTSGIVVSVDTSSTADKQREASVVVPLIGKRVFFEDYKDGSQVDIEGKKYAFIKWDDLRGYQND